MLVGQSRVSPRFLGIDGVAGHVPAATYASLTNGAAVDQLLASCGSYCKRACATVTGIKTREAACDKH
jgi:hypothetical protein